MFKTSKYEKKENDEYFKFNLISIDEVLKKKDYIDPVQLEKLIELKKDILKNKLKAKLRK